MPYGSSNPLQLGKQNSTHMTENVNVLLSNSQTQHSEQGSVRI